jgi:dolichol-phosphate mannosyltransferase
VGQLFRANLDEDRLNRVVVIIPTYNERNNIGIIVEQLGQQFGAMAHDMHILVVDDNSPDGTAEIVRALQAERQNLHLITGQKAGLGAAYIRGMRHAVDELGADVVCEMDADLSHKPEDLPRLIAEIDAGADFVIGSRYVKGGSIPSEWGLWRQANSLFGNIVARYVAGIYSVRDCTAGFRAIRARLLQKIDLTDLRVQGYAFQVALLHEAKVNRARIVEVPVDFIDRTEGESKLGLKDIVEFIVNAWWIRFRSSRTFLKFCAVGVSGVGVNLLALTVLDGLGLGKYVASPLAIEISIISNFLINNYWTFRWRRKMGRFLARAFKFNLVSLVALGVNYGVFILADIAFPNLPIQIHQLLGIAPAMVVNYLLNSNWTFRSGDRVEQQSG